jgi:hypothetical protein
MISDRLFRRFYPDNSLNGMIRFYDWIRQNIDPAMCILGAGPATKDKIRILRGEVAEVIGADPNRIVLSNPELDATVVLSDQKLRRRTRCGRRFRSKTHRSFRCRPKAHEPAPPQKTEGGRCCGKPDAPRCLS